MGLQLVVPLGRFAPAACSIFLSFVGPFLAQIPSLSLSLFFFQVHKSVLEGRQLFRALKQVLFLHCFYLLSKRKATLSPLERDYWESVMGLWPEVSVLAMCAKPARQALLYLPLLQTQKTIEISSYLLCLCGFWVRPSGGVGGGAGRRQNVVSRHLP